VTLSTHHKKIKETAKKHVQEMTMFFPATALCHESRTTRSMMDMDTGSHVLKIRTTQEGGRLHTCQTLEPVRCECPHLENE